MDFRQFDKIPRLSRDIVITEKIDGTNGQIFIGEDGEFFVGSRKRWVTPENDNYGFARWAQEHKEELMRLGPGRHFGEWWGQGIQRKYGLNEKRFSLFNVGRWYDEYYPWELDEENKTKAPECCRVVPILYQGIFDTMLIEQVLYDLEMDGSSAAPGFMKPEGIVIYHTAGNCLFKKTIEDDEIGKGHR